MSESQADVAIVTGAARGLGREICRALLDDGFRVLATDRSESGLAELAATSGNATSRFAVVPLDVTNKSHFESALAFALAHFGSAEVLVNNAALTKTTALFDISPEEFSRLLDVNLRGTFLGCQIFGRHFRERGYGRIVNMASLAAQNGGTATGGHYAASKGGIVTLTKVFARELATAGVTVNAIAPGPLDVELLREILPSDKLASVTAGIPVGRLGDPKFIGRLVVLLARRDAASMTGTTLDANGGLYLR